MAKFEILVSALFKSVGFNISHVGGPQDAGIDLIGVWRISEKVFRPFSIIIINSFIMLNSFQLWMQANRS